MCPGNASTHFKCWHLAVSMLLFPFPVYKKKKPYMLSVIILISSVRLCWCVATVTCENTAHFLIISTFLWHVFLQGYYLRLSEVWLFTPPSSQLQQNTNHYQIDALFQLLSLCFFFVFFFGMVLSMCDVMLHAVTFLSSWRYYLPGWIYR